MPQIVIVPERDLLAAVLARAILDANGAGAAYNSEFLHESREFLWLTKYPTVYDVLFPEAMSFIWICHWLDLDWRSMRKAIAAQLFIEPCDEVPYEVLESNDSEQHEQFDGDSVTDSKTFTQDSESNPETLLPSTRTQALYCVSFSTSTLANDNLPQDCKTSK